jgi:hypothetical protein
VQLDKSNVSAKYEMMINIKCEFCSGELGEFVHLNSFVYKCLKCKRNGPATSFESIMETLEGEYEIYITDEYLKKQQLIGKGEIGTLLAQIEQEASSDNLVYLKKIN